MSEAVLLGFWKNVLADYSKLRYGWEPVHPSHWPKIYAGIREALHWIEQLEPPNRRNGEPH